MQRTRYVIKPMQGTPRKFPVTFIFMLYILQHHAPEWLKGIIWLTIIFIIILFLWDCYTYKEKDVDIQDLLKRMDEVHNQNKK